MRIFIAHKVAGEDPEKLEAIIRNICNALDKSGHNYYCVFLEENKFNGKKKRDIMFHALKQIDKSDAVLVFVNSTEVGEGVLIEIGYTITNKKKIILAINKINHYSYARDVADKIIEFDDLSSLYNKLEVLK